MESKITETLLIKKKLWKENNPKTPPRILKLYFLLFLDNFKIETSDRQGPKENVDEAEQHNLITTIKRMQKFQTLNIISQCHHQAATVKRQV